MPIDAPVLVSVAQAQGLVVSEGVSSVWHYHLSTPERTSIGICGAWTMPTSIRLDTWGFKPDHMPSSYCHRCEVLAMMKP